MAASSSSEQQCSSSNSSSRCTTAGSISSWQQHAGAAAAAARTVAAAAAAAVALAAAAPAPPSWAATAAETFAAKCAGCHMQGGNVLAAGATLFPADLERNGRATPEAVYEIVYGGKGKMPGFGAGCAPKGACTFGPRLSDAEVREQAAYVLERAGAGWK